MNRTINYLILFQSTKERKFLNITETWNAKKELFQEGIK